MGIEMKFSCRAKDGNMELFGDTDKTKDDIAKYFKEIFSCDGKVKFVEQRNKFEIMSVIELNDAAKGKFFIGLVEETEDHKKLANFIREMEAKEKKKK